MLRRLALSAALLAVSGSAAWAEPSRSRANKGSDHFEGRMTVEYFWDGGAVPFLYGSLGVAVGLRLFNEPSKTPRLFPASEGGETDFKDSVPSIGVGIFAAAGGALVAFVPSSANLFHLKGYGEALFTTLALTQMSKDFFGRHRPHFQEGDDTPDHRRAFFSGHSSLATMSSMYLGIYFHQHIAPRLRGPRAGLYKALTYSILGAAFVGVPYSRVVDNRHHISDVLAGGFVGSATAALFYAYQESRYVDAREAFYRRKRNRLTLVPDLENRGLVLMTRW
jgi:membrane-associated phospholipid phosphatase